MGTVSDALALNGVVKGNAAAASALLQSAQPRTPGALRDVALDAQAKVAAFLAETPASPLLRAVQEQVRVSMRVIDEALDKYGVSHLSVSYNGGKDCLVLLILVLACLPRHFPADSSGAMQNHSEPQPKHVRQEGQKQDQEDYTQENQPQPQFREPQLAQNHTDTTSTSSNHQNQNPTPSPSPFPTTLQAVYIEAAHPFAEVDAFVAASASTYALDVARSDLPMQAALAAYLGTRPAVRAVFVGTRRTDPHGARLTHFDRTDVDRGWPDFMRVHPVIDWHYAEIWAFIRHLEIPYCPLYDRGYTSLGGTTDTHPNPALKKVNTKADGFRPAYELTDDYEERLGRDR